MESDGGVEPTGANVLALGVGATYSAEEESLLVGYIDDVLRVPLPGWSQEAVQTVVDGLAGGDWREFHDALRSHGVPSDFTSAEEFTYTCTEGSESDFTSAEESMYTCTEGSESDLNWGPPNIDVQEGVVVGLLTGFLGGLIVGGLFAGAVVLVWISQHRAVGVGQCAGTNASTSEHAYAFFCCPMLAWGLAALYRAWVCFNSIVWGGSLSITDLCRFVLSERPCTFQLHLPRASRSASDASTSWPIMFLIALILIFGLANPAEAHSVQSGDDRSLVLFREDQRQVASCPRAFNSDSESTGLYSLGLGLCVCVIGVWEILKWAFCRILPKKGKFRTAASQTEDQAFVPMPLPTGVPGRARILFSLWRAGFAVDTDCYPEEVQDDFQRCVGAYLLRSAKDEGSSDESG